MLSTDFVKIDAALSEQIERHQQRHILQSWNELSVAQQTHLIKQLSHVDWNAIGDYLSELSSDQPVVSSGVGQIAPPAHVVRKPKTEAEFEMWDRARQLGENALRAGTVGVILLAGGQGTRLGFPHPKGMFSIGPVSGKSLFELFAEQILATSDRFGQSIPYLIMTSDSTHDETVEYFEQNAYFGLDESDVFFFQQGFAPCLDSCSGKLLRSDKGSLNMSPDGHGGLLAALQRAGLFEELRRRKVEFLCLNQVDNPLVKVCDPTFLGLHLMHQADVSIKVVSKTDPQEKVGVAVNLNGRTAIVEYSDLPNHLANERDTDGQLRYWAGSTAIHVFNRSFLESVATSASSLPWHRARKKVPHLGDDGQSIEPDTENGIKFERFLFDTLPLAKTALVVETNRTEEFAPLKNKFGAFSADDVRNHMIQLAADWLKRLGVKVPDDAIVEISPRFANSPEELALRSDELANLEFDQPIYLGPPETDWHNLGFRS